MLSPIPPRVAHWLAALAGGLLLGAGTQTIVSLSGAGPQSILGASVVGLLFFSLARRLGTPNWFWRIGLVLPWGFFVNLDWLNVFVAQHSRQLTGSTAEVPTVILTLLALSFWPSIRILAQTLGRQSDRSSPMLLGLGILLSTLMASPGFGLAFGAIGLAYGHATLSGQRAHRAHRALGATQGVFHTARLTASALAGGIWLSAGWVGLRTVFDPTLGGAIAVVTGLTLGRTLKATPLPFIWVGIVGVYLWSTPHLLGEAAPQIAALGMNQSLGIDGRLWLALPLFFLGLIASPLTFLGPRDSVLPPIGLAAGLWFGPSVASTDHILWVASGALGLVVLFAKPLGQRAIAGGVCLFVVGAQGWLPAPEKILNRTSVWSKASSPSALASWSAPPARLAAKQHGLTPSGSFVTWTGTQTTTDLGMSLDGALGSSFGDKAQSEELAGHLGALLSPKSEAQILIGDWMGNALRGIAAHPPGLTHVAVSSVYALRSIANMDPVRQRLWLQPGHPLYGEFSASLTRRTPSVGSIIEINHSPWTSGANWGLDDGHISAIKAHLSPDGVYVLCVHMRWWADGALSQIAGALTAQFQSVTTWLPPEGVDSIIFVASDKAATYKTLASGFDHARAALLSLGFQSPEMLAGAAILGQNTTRDLGALDHPPLRPDRLSAGLFDRPTLHLSHAPELMKDQVDPWNGTAPPGVAEVRSAKATLLTMLSSATQGHLEGAFEAARALSNAHGATGKQALARVIEPHIRNARTALRHARSADPNSSKWDDAIRFATTARMLSPKSHTPLTLLGDIALARGFLPMALEHYKQALKIKPNHVPALEGLARCARLGDEPKKVGQALRDATHHAPRDWRTWHNLAVFHLENDDNTAAMTAIESALGLAPSEEVAPLLVLIKTQLRSGAAGAALLRADQVTKIAPKNGLGWYLRGRAHFDLDRMVEAENDFRQAVLIDGELIEARSGIGLVRAILGDEESARRIFKDVLEKDPANAAARENLRRLSGNAKP